MDESKYLRTKMCFSCRNSYPIYQTSYIHDHLYLCQNCLESKLEAVKKSNLDKRRAESKLICPHCGDVFTCFDALCIGRTECESCWQDVFQVHELGKEPIVFLNRNEAIEKLGQRKMELIDRRNRSHILKQYCPHCNDKLTFTESVNGAGLVHCETCANEVFVIYFSNKTVFYKSREDAVNDVGLSRIEYLAKGE